MHEKIFLFIKKYFLRREKENNGQKKKDISIYCQFEKANVTNIPCCHKIQSKNRQITL